MSLNICLDCNFEKKKCQCVIEPPKVKISWWRRIIYFLIG
jgi:hypothetical protein